MQTRIKRLKSIEKFQYLDEQIDDCHIILSSTKSTKHPDFLLKRYNGYYLLLSGSIYNLKKLANIPTHTAKTQSPEELITFLFQNKKNNLFSQLNGDFALTLFDIKNKTLHIVMDKFASKKMYYYFNNNCLIFATHMQTIISLLGAVPEIDVTFLSKYFAYGFVPSPNTLLKGIKKVPSCHYLFFDSKKINLDRYWDLNFEKSAENQNDEKKYAKHLYESLLDSTQQRLEFKSKTGVFLSGGLDSSAVVAMLSDIIPAASIHTFTATFKEKSFDESKNAKMISQYFKTNHHEILLTPRKALSFIESLIGKIDEPFSDDDIICGGLLAPFAENHVDEIFLGDGADELFMGYASFFAHKMANIYENTPKLITDLFEKLMQKRPMSFSYRSIDSQFKQFLGGMGYEKEIRDAAWWGPFPPKNQNCLFAAETIQNINLDHKHIYHEIDTLMKNMSTGNLTDKILSIYIKILNERWIMKLNALTQESSLKFKMPFFDASILEYSQRLPNRFKKGSKYILRKSLQSHLPPKIVHGKKRSFFVPMAAWMNNEFKPLLLEILSKKNISLINCLNYSHILELTNQHLSAKSNYAKQIWNLFILIAWYKNLKVKEEINL